jgi:hypothetical protein
MLAAFREGVGGRDRPDFDLAMAQPKLIHAVRAMADCEISPGSHSLLVPSAGSGAANGKKAPDQGFVIRAL